MIIKNNSAAMNAQLQLNKNIFAANSSLEKLSSGLRINRAADDAAGLAISEKLKALNNGLEQAMRNAQDGSSVIQIADGALSSTENALHRMRELAVQSSNDTLSDSDRELLKTEYDALSAEINNISEQTEFNGQKLLDGSFTDKIFHVGPNEDATGSGNITVSIDEMSSSNLGVEGIFQPTQASANSTIGAIDQAIEKVSSERGKLGATQNRLGYSVNNSQISSVNTSSAESRIRDSITSSEIMNQIRFSLLAQSSTAMLAKANQNSNNVLSLLR